MRSGAAQTRRRHILLTENSEPAASSDMVFNTVETLGRRIVRGDVAPGATLPVEQAICDELGRQPPSQTGRLAPRTCSN